MKREQDLMLEAIAWKSWQLAGNQVRGPFMMSTVRYSGIAWRSEGVSGDDALRDLASSLGHDPPSLFPAKEPTLVRRFLPLYGEGPADDARRMIDHMPRFGAFMMKRRGYPWFLNRKTSGDVLSRLFWFLDSATNVYRLSLGEVNERLSSPSDAFADALRDEGTLSADEVDEWLSDAESELEEFREVVEAHADGWSENLLGIKPAPHSCGLTPIEPPDVGGVYFVRSRGPSDWAIKIGWGKNIRKRLGDLRTSHPWPLELMAFAPGTDMTVERSYHDRFKAHRIDGSPGREWFHYVFDLVQEILSLRAVTT